MVYELNFNKTMKRKDSVPGFYLTYQGNFFFLTPTCPLYHFYSLFYYYYYLIQS